MWGKQTRLDLEKSVTGRIIAHATEQTVFRLCHRKEDRQHLFEKLLTILQSTRKSATTQKLTTQNEAAHDLFHAVLLMHSSNGIYKLLVELLFGLCQATHGVVRLINACEPPIYGV